MASDLAYGIIYAYTLADTLSWVLVWYKNKVMDWGIVENIARWHLVYMNANKPGKDCKRCAFVCVCVWMACWSFFWCKVGKDLKNMMQLPLSYLFKFRSGWSWNLTHNTTTHHFHSLKLQTTNRQRSHIKDGCSFIHDSFISKIQTCKKQPIHQLTWAFFWWPTPMWNQGSLKPMRLCPNYEARV